MPNEGIVSWTNQAILDRRFLPKDHDCEEEKCLPNKHYGISRDGLCLVCGGCGDPECCGCDEECWPNE